MIHCKVQHPECLAQRLLFGTRMAGVRESRSGLGLQTRLTFAGKEEHHD